MLEIQSIDDETHEIKWTRMNKYWRILLTIGSKLDVLATHNKFVGPKWKQAEIIDIDFNENCDRICVRFDLRDAEYDEWIDRDSERLKPNHTTDDVISQQGYLINYLLSNR